MTEKEEDAENHDPQIEMVTQKGGELRIIYLGDLWDGSHWWSLEAVLVLGEEFARDLESGGADEFLRREKSWMRMKAGGEERGSALLYL